MNTRLFNTLLLSTGFLFSPAVFSGENHSHDSQEHQHAQEHKHGEKEHQHEKDHQHSQEDQHAKEHEHAKEHSHEKTTYTSPKQAWQTLIEVVTAVEKNIESSNFRAVDDQNHTLEGLVDYLQHQSPVDDAAKQKRLEGSLKQLKSAIGELHEQGHNPTQEGLTKTMKKVRGAMKMVEAQQVF